MGFGLIAAIAEHRVNGVKALPGAALRAVALEGNTAGKDFPGRDQPTLLGNLLRGDVVQRTNLVLRAPFPPVAHLQRQFPQSLFVTHRLWSPLLAWWQAVLLGFPHDRVTQYANAADLDLNRIARVHRPHAFAGASVDHIAGIQRNILADKTDTRRHVKNEHICPRVLFYLPIEAGLERQLRRVRDLSLDPGPQGRERVARFATPPLQVAALPGSGTDVVAARVAKDIVERSVDGHALGDLADHDNEFT